MHGWIMGEEWEDRFLIFLWCISPIVTTDDGSDRLWEHGKSELEWINWECVGYCCTVDVLFPKIFLLFEDEDEYDKEELRQGGYDENDACDKLDGWFTDSTNNDDIFE